MDLSDIIIDIHRIPGLPASFSFDQVLEQIVEGADHGTIVSLAGTVVGTWRKRIPLP